MYFVDYCHQHDIGVILDWVPAHFPRDGHGLRRFDGTACYEHDDPRKGEHPDWGTMIFNYGRHEVRNFLLSNALFWLDKYHIDGLRVDAVASMLYLDYSRKEGRVDSQPVRRPREPGSDLAAARSSTSTPTAAIPGVLTIAEESTAWGGVSRPTYTGGLGFILKWNMGWMNDTLRYMRHDPIHRRYHHDELTFSLIYAFTENFVLPLSHDEVVHGKRLAAVADAGRPVAEVRQPAAAVLATCGRIPGKKLLFMGGDFGQWNEWNHDAEPAVGPAAVGHAPRRAEDGRRPERAAPPRAGPARGRFRVHRLRVDRLPRLRRQHAGLHPQGQGPGRLPGRGLQLHARRRGTNYRHRRARSGGWYQEVFNSDSQFYGGSNVGNFPGIMAEEPGWHGRPAKLLLTLPPLADGGAEAGAEVVVLAGTKPGPGVRSTDECETAALRDQVWSRLKSYCSTPLPPAASPATL